MAVVKNLGVHTYVNDGQDCEGTHSTKDCESDIYKARRTTDKKLA